MKPINIQNSILVEKATETFLSSQGTAAATTLTVENISGFSINNIILIGEFGSEGSEIIHTHVSTTPTGSTITLNSALVRTHPIGTKVRVIPYNMVEISHSDSETGVKAVLDTINIQPDSTDTRYQDVDNSSGFYFIRFKTTLTTPNTFSGYSDPIPYIGYSTNRVGNIITYAMNRNKLESFTRFITYDFCLEEINSCLKYIKGKLKKWTKLQEFDYELGTATRGVYSFSLPSNVWKSSHKSILDVRVYGGKSLKYRDKKEFNDTLLGVYKATASSASIGDTELTISDSTHFRDEGNVMVNGMIISYTSKNGNTLEGIPDTGDGSITASITSGDLVWQGAYKEATPEYYTVYGGNLYFWPMASPSKPRQNIVTDFWTEAPEVDSDNDEIDSYRYDIVKHWLTWAIRMQLKNDGIRDLVDGDYLQFEIMLRDAVRGEVSGQKYKETPKLNRIRYRHI